MKLKFHLQDTTKECSRIQCQHKTCKKSPPNPTLNSPPSDPFKIMGFNGYSFCSAAIFFTITILFLISVFSPIPSKIKCFSFEKNCFENFGENSEDLVERCFTALGSFCASNPMTVLLAGNSLESKYNSNKIKFNTFVNRFHFHNFHGMWNY